MPGSTLEILELIAVGVAGLVILSFLLRWPETAFALFLFSYVIEGGGVIPGSLDLTPILLFISLAGFLLSVLRSRTIRFSPRSSDLWLFIFLIVLLGGSYLAPDLQGGVRKTALFAVGALLPYLIARLFLKTYKQIRVFLVTILGIATGIAVILVTMSILPTYVGGRLQFLAANPIPSGTLLVVGLAIAVIGLTSELFGKSNKIKAFCIVVIPFCLYAVFLSGVRGPLISAIVGLAFYLLLLAIQRPRVLACVGATAILLLMTLNAWYPSVMRTVPNIGMYRLQAITQGVSTQLRLVSYQTAITLFTQQPLLGSGTDGFAQLTGMGYPHNIFLEIASENGLLGLIVFTCFLGSIVWSGRRYLVMPSVRSNPQARAIGVTVLTVALILFVGKQFSYDLTMHKDLLTFLGLAVNLLLIARLSSRPNYGCQRIPVEYGGLSIKGMKK